MTARVLSGLKWHNPLFIGNAAADSMEIAREGYQVIGLRTLDRERYRAKFEEREQIRGETGQLNDWEQHWDYHNKLFHERLPGQNTPPYLIDTMADEFDDQRAVCIRGS